MTETTTKPTYGGLNVTVGPNATRTSSDPQGRQYPPQRPSRRNPANPEIVSEYDQEIPQSQTADNPVAPGQNKGPRRGKARRANAP